MTKNYTYRFNKLVRDKTVPEYKEDDSVLAIDWRTLSDNEYKQALVNKLHEEVDEIPVANTPDEEVVSEIADTLDVLRALMRAYGITEEQVADASTKKGEKRGGFESRHHIESITLTPDSKWRRYCMRDPHRYPEINDNV